MARTSNSQTTTVKNWTPRQFIRNGEQMIEYGQQLVALGNQQLAGVTGNPASIGKGRTVTGKARAAGA